MPISSEPSYRPQSLLREDHQARILVAEDPYINSFLRTVLQRRGYKVATGEPYQSSELMRSGVLTAEMVITNTPQAFLPYSDSLPLLYIAATPDRDLASRFHNCRVLRKPFHNSELLEAVEELSRFVIP